LFFGTLSFISRIPVPGRWVQGLDGADYVRGITTFPLVGLLLGGLSGLLFMVLHTWCGAPLAALLSVLALALLTGGFHLDGLADTCDGVFSARRRERMLEIMRDEGLGNLFIGKVSGRDTFVTLIITALITVVLLGAQGVLALLVTMVAIYLLGWLLKRTLGGQTGDTLGAAIELGEVIFLFALL